MDHLQWRTDLPRPRPTVPYVCETIEDTICDDVEKLQMWPSTMRWDLSQEVPITTSARRCQAWLFFGLLQILTTTNGHQFNVNDFVAEENGCNIVDSTSVRALLHQVSGKLFTFKTFPKGYSVTRDGQRLFKVLQDMLPEVVPWMIKVVKTMEDDTTVCDLWISKSYNIFLSTLLLIEMVCNIAINKSSAEKQSAQYHCKPWIALFGFHTRSLLESLKGLGHCTSLIKRADLSLLTAFEVLALPAERNFDHSECSLEACGAFNVNHNTYIPQHAKDCDQRGCSLLRIDTDLLHNIIQKDGIPLIRSTMSDSNEVDIDIIEGDETQDFVAVSHVWAGGLGNMAENAHYQCQLKQIHVDLAKPPKLPYRTAAKPVLYWLDSLCIPVLDTKLKMQAINSMARIYAGSKTVLVIDPDLYNRDTKDLNLQEIDLAILCSPWMARSWTLQEGALAVNVVFRFADRLVPFEQLKFNYGRTQDTSIQALWSRDVDRVVPRGYFTTKRPDKSAIDDVEKLTDLRDNLLKVWNELSERSTSKPEDVVAIIATFVDRSAGEVLSLPQHARIQAILRGQRYLPTELLFVPTDPDSKTWSPCLPTSSPRKHRLQWTHGYMRFTSSGTLRLDNFASLHVLRSQQPTLFSDPVCIYDPVRKACCKVLFNQDENSKDIDTALEDTVLVFDDLWYQAGGFGNGKCFLLTKEAEDGLHIKYKASFTYELLSCQVDVHHSLCTSQGQTAANFVEVSHISQTCPLYIDMGVEWPQLHWSRSESYAFTKSSRQMARILHLFDYVASGVHSMSSSIALGSFLTTFRGFSRVGTAWMVPVSGAIFIAAHHFLLNVEYTFFWKFTNQDLQRKWARSFWTQSDTALPTTTSRSKSVYLIAVFYLCLFIPSGVFTVRMFLQIPALREVWNKGPQFGPMWTVFGQWFLDLQPDGGLRPWQMFITRHACRVVFFELLIRAAIIAFFKQNDNSAVRTVPDTPEAQGAKYVKALLFSRFKGARLFWLFVFVPTIVVATIASWVWAIQAGVTFNRDRWWITLIMLSTLVTNTLISCYLVVGTYTPYMITAVRSISGSLTRISLRGKVRPLRRLLRSRPDREIEL